MGGGCTLKLDHLKLQDGTLNEKGRINIGPEKKKALRYVKLTDYRLFKLFPKIGPQKRKLVTQ